MKPKKKYGLALWKQIERANAASPATKRNRIRSASPKRAKELAQYRKRVKEWIKDKICVSCSGIIHLTKAAECHHKFGRRGRLLNWENGWVALCSDCHHKIHNNPAWAREVGLLAPVGQFNNQDLCKK